jgi:quinol-cytochrome oxidoreductase complex cytochrome b subunit
MSIVLVTLLALSGALLMFVYEPVPGAAHESVRRLQQTVRFGGWVRNVHFWSANLLVIVAGLHLTRVFLTGGFHGPRRFNWIIGLFLFGCVLAANFTGYLLPWDQLSYWAVTITTGMLAYLPLVGEPLQTAARGGAEIGPATLLAFYTFHTTLIPALLLLTMGFHFWKVRKAGGVVQPPGQPGDRVLFVPNLLVREVAVGLGLVAVVVLLAALFDAGLGTPANPGMSPNPAKAPWYFLGLQELLLHLHPIAAVVLVPSAALLALLAVPYLAYDPEQGGAWFLGERGKRTARIAALLAGVVTPLGVVLDEFVLDFAGWFPALPAFLSQGVLPLALAAAGLAGFAAMLKRRYHATLGERVQAVFVLAAVSLVILTVVGIWFRGEGMQLRWPWMV